MSTVPVPPAPAESMPLSQGARIIDTFVAPSKTFNDLRRSASWWAPWLLISVISLIFIYSVGKYVGWEQISRNSIAQSPKRADQFEKLPPEQQARQMQISTTITRYIAYATPAVIVIAFLVIAAVLMGTFNLGMGASVPFKVSLAIVVYSGLPGIIGSILATISVVAGGMSGSLDREAFDIRNPVATNLAYFMDPMGNKFAYGMASALDLFVIWGIVLMGIGFACNSKVKRGTAIGTVAGWYLFYKLLGAGLAALFS
jgi:Yip1 domain